MLRSLSSGQHRDSAILSTSSEIASAVRAVRQLHCEARRAYTEPAVLLLYKDEIRSVAVGYAEVGLEVS